jgi:hypothetical protein
MNVFNNLKTQYDIFQSCLAGANIPLFFRQADVTPIVEQIMKERERAEKRFQRERAKHQVKPTNLLDGLGEALQVANDRRRIEESTYVRPKNHGKERRNRKQHTDAADSAGGK